MRLFLRDAERHPLGHVTLELDARPTRVRPDGSDRDLFLHWEGAVDDAGRLRKCLACGCTELFREKAFPQITGLIIVLAFLGALVGIVSTLLGNRGVAVTTPLLLIMVAILAIDVGLLLFTRRQLVCYRCRSSFSDLPIARYHKPWDRTTAARYPARAASGTRPGRRLWHVLARSRRTTAGAPDRPSDRPAHRSEDRPPNPDPGASSGFRPVPAAHHRRR